VPELTRLLFDLTRAGRIDDAMKLQYKISELFDAMLFPFEFPDGFRAAAELRGFNFGKSRQPSSQAQQTDRTALQSVLQCILSDTGLVEPPREGCPPRTRIIEQDKISQVVYEVLDELRSRGIL
jgi:4-hydroxy-tetrahydrodipicolinate synthase